MASAIQRLFATKLPSTPTTLYARLPVSIPNGSTVITRQYCKVVLPLKSRGRLQKKVVTQGAAQQPQQIRNMSSEGLKEIFTKNACPRKSPTFF